MTFLTATALNVMFSLSLVIGILYLVVTSILFGRIKRDHPGTYNSFGDQSFFQTSLKDGWGGVKFIVFGRYERIDDMAVKVLGGVARTLFILSMLLYAFIITWLAIHWTHSVMHV